MDVHKCVPAILCPRAISWICNSWCSVTENKQNFTDLFLSVRWQLKLIFMLTNKSITDRMFLSFWRWFHISFHRIKMLSFHKYQQQQVKMSLFYQYWLSSLYTFNRNIPYMKKSKILKHLCVSKMCHIYMKITVILLNCFRKYTTFIYKEISFSYCVASPTANISVNAKYRKYGRASFMFTFLNSNFIERHSLSSQVCWHGRISIIILTLSLSV